MNAARSLGPVDGIFHVLNLVYFTLSLPFLFVLFYFFQGIILDGGGLERKEWNGEVIICNSTRLIAQRRSDHNQQEGIVLYRYAAVLGSLRIPFVYTCQIVNETSTSDFVVNSP